MFVLSVGDDECGSQLEAVEGAESNGIALHGHAGSYQLNALSPILPRSGCTAVPLYHVNIDCPGTSNERPRESCPNPGHASRVDGGHSRAQHSRVCERQPPSRPIDKHKSAEVPDNIAKITTRMAQPNDGRDR